MDTYSRDFSWPDDSSYGGGIFDEVKLARKRMYKQEMNAAVEADESYKSYRKKVRFGLGYVNRACQKRKYCAVYECKSTNSDGILELVAFNFDSLIVYCKSQRCFKQLAYTEVRQIYLRGSPLSRIVSGRNQLSRWATEVLYETGLKDLNVAYRLKFLREELEQAKFVVNQTYVVKASEDDGCLVRKVSSEMNKREIPTDYSSFGEQVDRKEVPRLDFLCKSVLTCNSYDYKKCPPPANLEQDMSLKILKAGLKAPDAMRKALLCVYSSALGDDYETSVFLEAALYLSSINLPILDIAVLRKAIYELMKDLNLNVKGKLMYLINVLSIRGTDSRRCQECNYVIAGVKHNCICKWTDMLITLWNDVVVVRKYSSFETAIEKSKLSTNVKLFLSNYIA